MNETLSQIKKILTDANVDEADVKARIILREIGHLSVEDMLLQKNVKNPQEVLDFARRLAHSGAPIQHLLGYWDFMGTRFKVTPDTLIPRDETEFLTRCVLDKIEKIRQEKQGTINVLDIGTGSGAIACKIALEAKDTEVLGVDISSDALMVALENAQKLDLIKKVVFRKSDIFSALRAGETFDIIVSNPPYICPSDYEKLDDIVKNFEPKSALLAQKNGLEFYQRIIKDASKFLPLDGYIAFECGQNQARDICEMLEKSNFQVSDVIKDLAGIDRVVAARLVFKEEF